MYNFRENVLTIQLSLFVYFYDQSANVLFLYLKNLIVISQLLFTAEPLFNYVFSNKRNCPVMRIIIRARPRKCLAHILHQCFSFIVNKRAEGEVGRQEGPGVLCGPPLATKGLTCHDYAGTYPYIPTRI